MSLYIILIIAIALSVAFHFVGVYAGAKKTVWLMILIMWAGSINIAMSEVKEKAYEDLTKIEGKYKDTDKIIKEARPEISVYEMVLIKNSFLTHEPKE
ncbi:hypothetical protein [Sulfurimonas sp.]